MTRRAATRRAPQMWRLRVREHGFHLLLTSPAILLCVVFLVVPLLALLDRSVRDGPRGVLVENEVVQPVPSGAVSTVRVSHAPLAGLDRGGRVTAGDVTVKAVTPVAVE